MSLQNIPEVPGVDPAAVRALTRLCSGDDTGAVYTRKPYLFYIGDDPYLLVTDGSTLVLLLLENGLPDKSEIEWDDQVQMAVGSIIELFGTDHITYFEDISVEELLAWCREGTESCPKCGGTKTCLYPRHGSTMANREDPKVGDAHLGAVYGIGVDRRRIQVTLQMLGVDEGTCDLSIYQGPNPRDENGGNVQYLIFMGENWRLLTAVLRDPGISEDTPKFL